MLASATLQTLVWTSRMTKADEFYGGLLGLPLKGRSHGASVYAVGAGELRVSPVPATQPSEHTMLGFGVTNIGETADALLERGIVFERFPGFPHDARGILTTPEGAKVLWFRDPDGNLLSVVQYA